MSEEAMKWSSSPWRYSMHGGGIIFFVEGKAEPLRDYVEALAGMAEDQRKREAREQRRLEWVERQRVESGRQMRALMGRIEARQTYRASKTQAVLSQLSDHEYIEWKFAVAARPSRRWLAPL